MGPRYSQKDQAAVGEYDKTNDHGKETETKVLWPHFSVFWLNEDDFTSTVKGKRIESREKKKWESNIKE